MMDDNEENIEYSYYARQSDMSRMFRRSTMHRSSKSLAKIPIPRHDLDMTDVLDDVFNDYLKKDDTNKNKTVFEVNTKKYEIKRTQSSQKRRTVTFAPVSRLDLVMRRISTSQIHEELIDKLKAAQENPDYNKLSKEDDRCGHLPRGFGSEEKKIPLVSSEMAHQSLSVHKYSVTEKQFKLVIDPPEICFSKYSVGSSFKKSCLLRNEGKSLIKGRIIQPAESQFQLSRSGDILLSIGLPEHLTVTFSPVNLQTVNSTFSIVAINDITDKRTVFTVPLVAKRQGPLLSGFKTDPYDESYKYLDCGINLIDRTEITRVKLTNNGSLTTFVISVIKPDVKKVKCSFGQKTDKKKNFSVFPRTFVLDKNESVDLKLSFNPDKKGKFEEYFRIKCNDGSEDEFALIGVGCSMDRKQLEFNKDIEKIFPVDIEDDMDAEYFLDLMRIHPSGIVTKSFTITSNCKVPLKFHWETRDSATRGNYHNFPNESLILSPNSGILQPMSVMSFQLRCQMNEAEKNSYRSVISLVVDELTPGCLVEGCQEFIVNYLHDSDLKLVSLCCGEIEVWLDVVLPSISVTPCYLHLTSINYRPVSYDVSVKNWGYKQVVVRWSWEPNTSRENDNHQLVQIDIDPVEAKIGSKKEYYFNIRITFDDEKKSTITNLREQFVETLVCTVNGGESFTHVSVSCLLLKSRLDNKVVGSVDDRHEGGVFKTLSKDLISLHPETYEGLVEVFRSRIEEINNLSSEDIKVDSDQISNLLEKLSSEPRHQESGLICGMAVWDKEDVAWIIGDIRVCGVNLEPPYFQVYLFHQFHDRHILTMYNCSLLPAKYKWGKPFGRDADMLNCWITKCSGVLQPSKRITVEIFLFPQHHGDIKDYFVPCTVENMPNPLHLRINGVVEPLRILVQWDTDQGFFQTSWDPSDSGSYMSNIFRESTDDLVFPKFNMMSSATLVKILSDLKMGAYCESNNWRDARYDCLTRNLEEAEAGGVVKQDDLMCGLLVPGNTISIMSHTCGPLGCLVGSTGLSKVYERALCFKLRTGQSQSMSVSIKNLTPIKTSFSAKVEVFNSRTETPEYPPGLLEDNISLNFPSKVWRNRVAAREIRKSGLFLDVTPNIRELDSYQDFDIRVTAYPDVWGEYMDVLVIKVGGLPSYSVPVSVQVTGPPISFTFDPRPDPVFRFGTLTPLEESCQVVSLRNNTYVPLKIAWTVYTKPLHDFNPEIFNPGGRSDLPFSLAIDIHSPVTNNFCELKLIEYLGLQEDNPYVVEPGVMHLEPYGEKKMKLFVKVPDYSDEGILEATCVGIIYEDVHQRGKWRSLCYRPIGLNNELFKLSLISSVEIPRIHVINIEKEDLCFVIHVTNLVKKGHYTSKRKYILKNASKAATYMSLKMENPFKITSVSSRDGQVLTTSDNTIFMKAHQTVEIMVEFYISKGIIGNEDMLVVGGPDDEEMCTSSAVSSLIISQPKLSRSQVVKFHYKLMYPFLRLSSKRVVFGPVFVNETRVRVFRITSVIGTEPITIVQGDFYMPGDSPFSFTPTHGVIRKGRYLEIAVSFSPSESQGYLDELFIETAVPNWTTSIILEGVGTWNYKFHQIVQS